MEAIVSLVGLIGISPEDLPMKFGEFLQQQAPPSKAISQQVVSQQAVTQQSASFEQR